MKARRIDRLVIGCQGCPFAHYEDAADDTFCTGDEDGDVFSLEHEVYANKVHKKCPLPEEEIKEVPVSSGDELLKALGLDPQTTAGVACCSPNDEEIDFNHFCAQMVEIKGIPDEWLDKLILSDAEKAKLQEDENARINELLEESGLCFPETFDISSPPCPEK